MADVYYDPYDVDIYADPYPVYARLREEAPLYYNEPYDFWAVSRWTDVERGLVDAKRFISGRGGILELIKAGIEMPPGTLIFEDPPVHTIHRSLLSRVFTPRRVSALEPKIREFCAHSLDPLVGSDGFDFIADLGAQMPMRVIGMLFGIPEADLVAVREGADAKLRTQGGPADDRWRQPVLRQRDVRRLHRLADGAPVRRPDERPVADGVRRRERRHAHTDPR